jgi:hypothetical protein
LDGVFTVELQNAFLDIVNVEEELHFARWAAEFRNVSFKIFLNLLGQIAEAKADHCAESLGNVLFKANPWNV